MNITLSAPDETVRAVRQWAGANHTSLNQFIRDRLEEKARQLEEERSRRAAGFSAFLDTVHVKMPRGWKFSREEANER